MRNQYDKSARALVQQKRERLRIKRRKKIVGTIGSAIIVIAMSVGMSYMALEAWDKESEIREQQTAEYLAQYHVQHITPEEKAAAEEAYYEYHYSPERIEELKGTIIGEYGNLIDIIIENDALKSNSVVVPLGPNRYNEATEDYKKFKLASEQDKTNYYTVSEEVRIAKATDLYRIEQKVLEDQLTEANKKAEYKQNDPVEYKAAMAEVEQIQRKINSNHSDLGVVVDKAVTMELEKKRAEEYKQR